MSNPVRPSLRPGVIRLRGRRGVALLMVLAVLVLVVASLAPLARLAGLSASARQAQPRLDLGTELLSSCDLAALEWLNTTSMRVALPPGTPSPAVAILHDHLDLDVHRIELSLTAFDQLGMVPMHGFGQDRLLSMTVDDRVARLAKALAERGEHPMGLDVVACSARPEEDVFPSASWTEPVNFGVSGTRSRPRRLPAASSFGETLATHPAPAASDRAPSTRINVNTAPRSLLRAAMLSAGRGDAEAVERSRERGRPFLLSTPAPTTQRTAPVADNNSASGPNVELVSFSNCWAIRIDIAVDGIRRSWWSVYTQTGSSWQRVQRLAIPR